MELKIGVIRMNILCKLFGHKLFFLNNNFCGDCGCSRFGCEFVCKQDDLLNKKTP